MCDYDFNAAKIKDLLVSWVRDFFLQNATPDCQAVVGISGGKDSSIVAALCVEALGKERVFGVLMPQGTQSDIDVSLDLCGTLGINYTTVNIGDCVAGIYAAVPKSDFPELTSVTTFNTPSRIRMTVLYAVAGSIRGGGRVSNNCNLSEDYVGYSTKFGDSAGDFSPLSDLTVTEVKAVGYELGLPSRFIEKTPIDGLCGKSDEDNLGFSYAVLDKYIRTGVCDDAAVRDKIDSLHKSGLHKLSPIPAFKLTASNSTAVL
ncbi:MAG: NAD(+) synthase [Oscillospiraceae bacterium]|nr:NAD(+) synthase [Oscillospiraceae bacterium]